MYLSYVGIRVTNLERSLKFYEKLFGLEEVDRGDNSKFGMGVFVLLRDGKSGMKLELNWYPKGSKYDAPYVVGEGLDHLAFCADDIEESFRQLVAHGATPTDFGPQPPRSYCYVKDPDGNWIELYQRKKPVGKKIPKGY
jgi:catechol 2,3-dioxygenase-like lactoylglutathione lyase family enzyme